MSIPSITRQWLKISTVKLHSVERADTMARMGLKILAINPGSTSTKLAIYEDTTECWKKGVGHSSQDIARSRRMQDQLELRSTVVHACLTEAGIKLSDVSAVVGRGGLLKPLAAASTRSTKR